MYRESAQGFDSEPSHDGGYEWMPQSPSTHEEFKVSATERRLILNEVVQCLEQALSREPDLLGGDLPLRKDIAAALRVLTIPDYPGAAIRLLQRALEREPDLLAGDLPIRRDIAFALHMLSFLTSRS